MSRLYKLWHSDKGFTIVEIMIATTVLSVILVLATTMMIGIGKLYYKGINQNRVQDNVRAASDEVSQHLQLAGADPQLVSSTTTGKVQTYCVGNTRYSFVIGKRIGPSPGDSHHSPRVLWRDINPNSGTCTPVNDDFLSTGLIDPSLQGVELIGANTRLTAFTISSTSPYTVNIGLAYGDDSDGTLFTGLGINTTCAGTAGDQFCATAKISSTVAKRLTSN